MVVFIFHLPPYAFPIYKKNKYTENSMKNSIQPQIFFFALKQVFTLGQEIVRLVIET
jgi:hypothetical protein